MRRTTPSPDPVTHLIGKRLPALRQGMSQEELGRRMSALGCEGWGRTSVQKLENGRRGSLSVRELLALALVFGVPPVLLVADPRTVDRVPVAAGVDLDAWTVLLWLTGEMTLVVGDDAVSPPQLEADQFAERWHHAAHAVRALENHEAMRQRYGVPTSPDLAQRVDEVSEALARQLADALTELTKSRPRSLPALPAEVLAAAQRAGVDLPGQDG